MVIDSSALLAILLDEPGADVLRHAIADAETRLMSAATLLESSLVIVRRKAAGGGRELDLLISKLAMEIVPVDAEQVEEARRGWRRFGRGRHAAALNYGDLFAYALSRTTGEPLLFTGDDFARTDVARVI
ncbi:MAG: type II toxin-antitoxin system VapC family toxin [Cyanobacteria bacterium]|nr:type II toxin-antitoxin system VapC family toxin [Cyanobacteriota bacterium]